MTAEELKEKYWNLYEYMANSKNPEYMKIFGGVMTSIVMDMIASSPSKAEEYIDRLEAVKWKNFLTAKEADTIVASMNPKAPWGREQWKAAMTNPGYEREKWPCYNEWALFATMNMIMSDSSNTLTKYVDNEHLFKFVHDLAVDKLTDQDKKFNVRIYFGL
jgi:hypothetical protein